MINNITKINNVDIQNKEYKGQRVITFEDIDLVHQRVSGTASRNFRSNRDKFVIGEDYFEIPSDEIRRIGLLELTNNVHKPMLFFTEQGYLMLVKSLTDDLAWEVQRKLVKSYFREKNRNEFVVPQDYPSALRALADQVEVTQKLQLENKIQSQQIAELKPRADYTDKILQNKGTVTITQIAKDYGMSGREMNNKLKELNIQYKQSGQWLLYSKYQNKGYTHSETVNITRSDGSLDIAMNTKWTQKGRLFLYEKLKTISVIPTIEREM